MVNKNILQGRFTRDPEVQQTQSGLSVVRFTLATDRKFAKEKTTDFIDCEAWRQTAEFIGKYFKKGSECIVCGAIQTDRYETKEGEKRSRTYIAVDEVNFCGSKSDNAETEKREPKFEDVTDAEDLPF